MVGNFPSVAFFDLTTAIAPVEVRQSMQVGSVANVEGSNEPTRSNRQEVAMPMETIVDANLAFCAQIQQNQ